MADEKTTEEKAAEAKAAAEAQAKADAEAQAKADAEAAAKAAAAGGEEDLSTVDTSKYTHEESLKFVAKLQDENARRRIVAKKLADEKEELEATRADLAKKHDDLTKRIEGLEKEKKTKSDAEKSEIEQLRAEMDSMKTTMGEYKVQIDEKDKALAEKEVAVSVQSREIMVDRLLSSKGVEFSSEFERNGFMAKLTKIENGKFDLIDEEVILEVNNFAKEAKTKEPPPKTPGAGPPNKTGEVDYATEIRELAAKPFLTEEDKKRLNELSELSSQAAEMEESARNPRL
jgi:hypothetical protein